MNNESMTTPNNSSSPNVHIITGPNGRCMCGTDGKTCAEILAGNEVIFPGEPMHIGEREPLPPQKGGVLRGAIDSRFCEFHAQRHTAVPGCPECARGTLQAEKAGLKLKLAQRDTAQEGIRTANPTIVIKKRNIQLIFDTNDEATEFFNALRLIREKPPTPTKA